MPGTSGWPLTATNVHVFALGTELQLGPDKGTRFHLWVVKPIGSIPGIFMHTLRTSYGSGFSLSDWSTDAHLRHSFAAPADPWLFAQFSEFGLSPPETLNYEASSKRNPMFTELMPLLRKRGLLLTISLVEGDTLRATVLPQKASDADDKAMTTPLAITGTAEELDRDLPHQLIEFVGAHLQLQSTLASAKADMDAAAKAAREEARKKTTKPATPTKASVPDAPAKPEPEPEPSLFAQAGQSQPDAAAEGGAA